VKFFTITSSDHLNLMRNPMLRTVSLMLLLITGVAMAQDKQIEKPSVICTKTPSITTVGDSNQCINWDGLVRTYILHIPPGYNSSTRVPLVLVLHGMGGSAQSIEADSGMSAKADQENFIVVYPNATKHPDVWDTNLGPIGTKGVDDVGFIRALIDRLEHDLRIDSRRIYICGLSSGANMTYLLGARLSHRLAAIGIASGTVGHTYDNSVQEIPSPSEPVPVIAFHGEKDGTIPYEGGGKYEVLPVAESIKFWVKADGCASSPQKTARQNGDLIIDDYGGCMDGSEVILYSFKNGTHEWPTLQNNDNLSATNSMWEFFVSHPRR
jgi:polyhydroxybutyrate depolymerase